jgi:hypothetical protein
MSPDMSSLDDTILPKTPFRSRNVIRVGNEIPQWMSPYYKHLVAPAVIRSFSKVEIVNLIAENLAT